MRLFAPLSLVSVLLCVGCAPTPTYTYQCESSAVIEASYPDAETARVRYQDRTYELTIAVSASGARYVGEQLEWWTKGSGAGAEARLFQHHANGTTGDTVESCVRK
ncbi:hypothetical protein PSI9734_00045 [Pseudidiomarina piscicola]|uniref:C-type lysozyme inhibitor domain-containing protein n=1 Tax=Pseudidiomarina piscicola TaxID=2614830 RepID=A0A6Y9WJH6_9GAMM|nr:MliC family protein [Pseudidiomarina piscicola]CAB0149481.1 hypothetical protein PSI9734_00045 [Pseudidiomarina piscicola]VZT38925.1 hypothetical protein PSI9734_00045 [Pseudomonas aeruginosa]